MAVIAAMVQEIRPVVRSLHLEPAVIAGQRVREGVVAGRRVIAVVTSMGTRAASEVTETVVGDGAIDHVIVVGICGSIDPGRAIGSLVVPAETVIEATGRSGRPLALGPHRPAGRLLTTDRLHNDPESVAELRDQGFVAVDMETGAIGAVCDDRGIPWSVFRAVSDRAGDPAVDTELLGMSGADGTPDVRAVVRYVLRHPNRLPTMASLGRGMSAAIAVSSGAALDVLAA